MKTLRVIVALMLAVSTHWAAAADLGTPIPIAIPVPSSQGGYVNVCAIQGTPCKADTLWVNETISCSGSPAVITGMAENLTLSPYAGAQAVVTGCGPATAANVVQTGVTVTAGGTSYTSSPLDVAGDYIVIGGGTPVNGSSFTASISHTTGIMTVTAMTSGTIYLGTVLTFTGQAATNVTFVRDFISGTGGTGTYQTTYTSGADLASTTITGTNNTVLRVLQNAAGVVTAAGVVGGGQYSTAPGAPQTQGTSTPTSGSGTSATFTLSYVGLPLTGQVASVQNGGFTFVNGVNAVTTYASLAEQLTIGHDDSAAVAAAIAKNPIGIVFPDASKSTWSTSPLGYGFLSSIALPNFYRVSMLCNGARILALGPMSAQISIARQSNTSLLYKPNIANCDLQGMGVAQYGVYNSSAQWQIQDGSFENHTIEDIFIGDSAGDNANDVTVSNTRIHTDGNAVPAWPAYNYENFASADQKIIGATMDHAMWANVLMNGADVQITGTHVFAVGAGPCYDVESAKDGIDGICDNPSPGQAGYFLNGSETNVKDGWMVSLGGSYQGQFGVYLNTDAKNNVGCGTGDTGAAWAGNTANLVFFAVTQATARVAPCTGNGASDPVVFTGPLTNTGQHSIVPVNGQGGAAIQNTNAAPAAAADLNISLNAKSAAAGSNLAGGNVVLNAGNGDTTAGDNQAGGSANINAGNGAGTGAGGGINVVSGNGGASGTSGTVIIKASTTGSSQGPVTIANAASGAVNILTGASSGVLHLDDGTGSGNIQIGNSNDQVRFNTGFASNGSTITLGSGTGACATSSTLTGGPQAGSFACTGTAGASTQIINLPASGTHGWACSASDVTSGVVWAQSTPIATTSCKISGTLTTTSDVVVFHALAY